MPKYPAMCSNLATLESCDQVFHIVHTPQTLLRVANLSLQVSCDGFVSGLLEPDFGPDFWCVNEWWADGHNFTCRYQVHYGFYNSGSAAAAAAAAAGTLL